MYGGASIVSDPRNADVVYLAGCRLSSGTYDGLYRSLDGGTNWTLVAGGPGAFTLQHGGQLILVDGETHDPGLARCLVIYAGLANGMLVSTNGGSAWTTNSLFTGHRILDLEFSVSHRDTMYVATDWGFYRYNTASNAVTKIGAGLPDPPPANDTSQWDLDVSPLRSNGYDVIYAATSNGVWKSADGGAAFVLKANGLMTNLDGKGFCRIAVSPRNPDRLLTVPSWWLSSTGAVRRGPFWSHDGGENWNYAEEEPNAGDVWNQEILERAWRWHTKPVVFDPDNAEVAMTFLQTPVKSLDGGRSWHYSGNGQIGARVNDISFPASNQLMVAMTDYGMAWSSDGGQRFELKDASQCLSADLLGERAILGYENGDVYMRAFPDSMKSYGTGRLYNWTRVTNVAGTIHLVRFHSSNTNIVYAGSPYVTGYVSFNAGSSWTNIAMPIHCIDPANSDVVYGAFKWTATGTIFVKSTNHGRAYTQLGFLGTNYMATTYDMDANPFGNPNSRDLIAAIGAYGIGLYSGASGVAVVRDATAGLVLETNEQIRSVRYDPVHSNIVWAGVSGIGCHGRGVYLSQDGGWTWTNVSNNLGPYETIFNIAVSPYDGTVYVTGGGLYSFSIENVLNGVPQQPRPLQDTDGDGIPDGWELEHFDGITNGDASADADGDGLSNFLEYRAHTSPANGDSDGDGMADGWEHHHFGDMSQPGLHDIDGDLYSNLAEYYWGTDPNEPDSRLQFEARLGEGYLLEWNSATGRSYDLLYTDHDLADSNLTWSPLNAHTNLPGTGHQIIRTNAPDSVDSLFYRLSVHYP